MQMTNEQMAANIDTLTNLQETGKLGYAIARNLRLLRETATEFLEARNKFMKEYGTVTDEATGRVTFKIIDYYQELGEILNIKHDVDIFTVDEDTFIGGGLTSQQMDQLIWMVKPDSEKETIENE